MSRTLGIVMLAVSAAALPAARLHTAADSQNAATWYAKAVEKMGAAGEEELNAVFEIDWNDPRAEVSPEVRMTLLQLQEAFSLVRRGGQQELCDYQLDRSRGFELTLPHLMPARKLARLLRADAMVRLREGDAAGAADRLATVYRMADHAAQDGLIISSLVGQAMFSSADQAVQGAIDRGELGAADAAAVLQAARQLPADDPFEYVEGVVGEQEMMIAWLDALLEETGTPEGVSEMLAGIGAENEAAAELAEATPGEFHALLDQADDLMTEVVGVFMLEDRGLAQEEMARLSAEIEGGEHGLLATLLLPAYGKVLENKFKAMDMLAARVRSLEAIVKGQVTPAEAANAAVWYLRGIEMLERLPREQRQAVRALASATGRAAPEQSAVAALDAAGPIIDAFREGSQKRRCDFAFARPQQESMVRAYVGGMREAARLLEADAVRAHAAGDAGALVDRLAISFRMSAHLAMDQAIISALTAHTMFTRTMDLAGGATLAVEFMPEERSQLAAAAEMMSRKDPFGYVEALAHDRALAVRWIRRLPPPAPGSAAQQHATPRPVEETIAAWDGDQLLHRLIVLDARLQQPAAPPEPAAGMSAASLRADHPWRQLDDVLSLEGVEQAVAASSAASFPETATGTPGPESLPALDIGGVEEHLRKARGDLRLALGILDPVAKGQPTP